MLINTSENNTPNPLDHVEEILSHHNWTYSRMTSDELMLQITGKTCGYSLIFVLQENMSALQFCCQYNLRVNPKNIPAASLALMQMNADLWMGHFEIARETLTPSFRHTSLLRGMGDQGGFDSIQDLVDISLVQCERFLQVFSILAQEETATTETLSLAIMETHGES